jgi:predicted RNA-binding protein with PUA-like domain
MNHWLLKSEPSTFSIDDLAARPRKTTAWDGVRNYQARNMLRDSIKKGDSAFFYHSSCDVPCIAGIVTVVKSGYPEPGEPGWYVVDVKLARKLARVITLDALRKHADGALSDLLLLRRGNRLSVTPVSKKDWDFILTLE